MNNNNTLLIVAAIAAAAYLFSKQKKSAVAKNTAINQTTPLQRNPNTSVVDQISGYIDIAKQTYRTGKSVIESLTGGGNSGEDTISSFNTLDTVGDYTGGYSLDHDRMLA